MKKIVYLLSVFVFGIITSCTQAPKWVSNSQEVKATALIISTDTARGSIPTQIIATTLPTLPSSSIDRGLEVASDPSATLLSTGKLILRGQEYIRNDMMRNAVFRVDMKTNEKVEISQAGENILDISISPDRHWMAYQQYISSSRSENLIIADSSGQQHVIIPWKTDWAYLSSWLDNERLLFGTIGTSDTEAQPDKSLQFVAFNPFANQQSGLRLELPQVFVVPGFSGLVGRGFSPDFDRVVYLQGDASFLEPLHYLLWDIEEQRSLAEFDVVIQPTAFPSWSTDGSKYALAASIKEDIYKTWPSYELYSVGRHGQVTQLTHLTDYYSWVYVEDYAWSPDGRYVAFWFSNWSDNRPDWELQGPRYLGVVDTKNDVVRNYCIEGKPGTNGRIPLPLWSPDGEQLVIESPSEGVLRVVLIDLALESAIQIHEDMTPVGWMAAP